VPWLPLSAIDSEVMHVCMWVSFDTCWVCVGHTPISKATNRGGLFSCTAVPICGTTIHAQGDEETDVGMFADVQHLHHVSQVARCSVLSLSLLPLCLSLSRSASSLATSLPFPLSLSSRGGRWYMTPHIRAAGSMGLDRKRATATLPRESLRRRHAATGWSP
jgi:hypothetical protein